MSKNIQPKNILLVDRAFKPLRLISAREVAVKLYTQKIFYIIEPDVVQLKHRIVPMNIPVGCSKKAILMRDNYTCQYCGQHCGKHAITVDHILPTSRGGKLSFVNCVAACEACNHKKKNLTPEEANMELLTMPVTPSYFAVIKFHGGESILQKLQDWMNTACNIAA